MLDIYLKHNRGKLPSRELVVRVQDSSKIHDDDDGDGGEGGGDEGDYGGCCGDGGDVPAEDVSSHFVYTVNRRRRRTDH